MAQRDGGERLEHEEFFRGTLHLRTNTAGRISLSGGTAATECEGKGRISALPGAVLTEIATSSARYAFPPGI